MGGYLEGRLWPRNGDERGLCQEQGYDVSKILYLDDLVKGDDVSGASGKNSGISLMQ